MCVEHTLATRGSTFQQENQRIRQSCTAFTHVCVENSHSYFVFHKTFYFFHFEYSPTLWATAVKHTQMKRCLFFCFLLNRPIESLGFTYCKYLFIITQIKPGVCITQKNRGTDQVYCINSCLCKKNTNSYFVRWRILI